MLRRGQSRCRRWAKRRLWMGALGSRGWMAVVPEKLDVDGVGGTRLESISNNAVEWEEMGFVRIFLGGFANENVTFEEKNAIPDRFPSSAVVSVLCKTSLVCMFRFNLTQNGILNPNTQKKEKRI